jgi:hypothetical protein
LAYLNLRRAVDETDAYEIAGNGEANGPAAAKAPADKPPTVAGLKAAAPRPGPLGHLLILAFMVATWVLTAWLFARVGGQNADWLGWGVGGHFMPPARGYYGVASVVAGVWGFLWIAAPILVMVRGAWRRRAEAVGEAPTEPAGGAGSAEPLLK